MKRVIRAFSAATVILTTSWAVAHAQPPADASPSTPSNTSTEGAQAHQVQPPAFVKIPTTADLSAAYPPRAMSHGVGGKATVRCTVGVDGLLSNCEVLSESPPNYGFGAATAGLCQKYMRMRPATGDGSPIPSEVTIPLTWSIG